MTDSKRKSQSDHALRQLRALVLSGAFAPGERIGESAAAEQLGISRTPLRWALDHLVGEGLLERSPAGGCSVVQLGEEDVRDAIELRGILEGTAARFAAERGLPEALGQEAEHLLCQIDQALAGDAEDADAVDFDGYVAGNAAFHRLLARMSQSAVLIKELERVNRLPLASPSAFLAGQERVPGFVFSMRFGQRQHRSLLAAIRAREGSRAEALAREHAQLTHAHLTVLRQAGPQATARVPGLSLIAAA